MQMNSKDLKKLRELEESMWRSETRFDRKYMERTLSPDFFELGQSGRVYARKDVLDAPPQEIKARLPLRHFKAHPITEGVVLVTYISETGADEVKIANRSSVWAKTRKGWQLRFHQGTQITVKNK
jgi:ribonuclease HI